MCFHVAFIMYSPLSCLAIDMCSINKLALTCQGVIITYWSFLGLSMTISTFSKWHKDNLTFAPKLLSKINNCKRDLYLEIEGFFLIKKLFTTKEQTQLKKLNNKYVNTTICRCEVVLTGCTNLAALKSFDWLLQHTMTAEAHNLIWCYTITYSPHTFTRNKCPSLKLLL